MCKSHLTSLHISVCNLSPRNIITKAHSLAQLETLQPWNLLHLQAQLPKSLNLLSQDYLSTLEFCANPRVTHYVISHDLDENPQGMST